MSLAEIQRKIISDAEQEAAILLEKAKSQAAVISGEADAEIAKIEAHFAGQFSREEPEIHRRREIVSDLDIKKILLGERYSLINRAFSGALDRLANLPKEKYLSFAEKLLDRAVESGSEKVRVSPSERHITEEWVAGYNEKRGKTLTLSTERADIAGGFILQSGDIQTNCSWDMLLRWVRDDIEADVAQRLFSE